MTVEVKTGVRFIESPRNPLVRNLRALHRNRARRLQQQFLIEGMRLLEEAMASGCRVDTVLYCAEAISDSRTEDLLSKCKNNGVLVIPASRAVVASVSETETSPGLIAMVHQPQAPEIITIVGRTDLAILCDQIQDPGNAGTIIRTAEAASAGGVFLTGGSVYPFSSKVIRSSMGSLFRLPIRLLADDGCRLCNLCLDKGWQLVFGVPGQGVPWWQVDFTLPTLLVLGNESAGINKNLLELPATKTTICIAPQVDSLNVAIAGAVLLFEAVRQRTANNKL